jgi:predicted O-methyltransferase YrrM
LRKESEFTGPSEVCPHPEWWTTYDGNTIEWEGSVLIGALVRATQPEFIVETGTWRGQTAESIGRALVENGHGILYSLEIDANIWSGAVERCKELTTVHIINISSFDYIPPQPVNFLFVDGAHDREGEVKHFLPYMAKHSVIVVHDTASLKNQSQLKNIIELCDEHIIVDIPRGLLIAKMV